MALLESTTNGGAVADATDNFDAMDKLIDFLTGITGSLAAIEQWTVHKDDTTTLPGERYVYLEGPGLSGTDNIYVVIRVYDDIPTDSRNWEMRGATGYDSGSAWDAQPGISTVQSFLTLNDDVAMPFWFVASGRRFVCVFKITTTYPACYCGWYLPYATPSQFPYPMYNGGSAFEEDVPWNTTDYTVGNFYDGPAGTSVESASVGQLRHRDGSWLRCGSYNDSTSGVRPTSSNSNVEVFATMYDDARAAADDFDKAIIDNPDGSYPVVPVVLYTEENDGNVYGELDGVFWTASRNNSAESTITDGGDTYLVVQNMYRTSEVNMALLLA